MAIFKEGSMSSSDRSQWDRKRHRQLVEDAIKKNLGGIIAEESIIGQGQNKKIKIPIKGIKEYQFIYGKNSGGAGSGTGGETRGQVVGKNSGEQASSSSGKAGNEPGEDIFETEITLDELIQYLFEELKLPDMERKKLAVIESERKCRLSGYQKKGIPPRLAKKRSVIEKLKRTQSLQQEGEKSLLSEERIPFIEDDLRYRRVKEEVRRHSNAVVICIMDTSGSMDQTRKYLARSFYFLLYQFVRYKYEQVELVFIAHTTKAWEVDEEHFFHKGESGGTFMSSGYAKALEIIEQRYNPAVWNIYAFHCSDGDNWSDDNPKAITLIRELCQVCNLFGYCEVAVGFNWNSMRKKFQESVKARNFIVAAIRSKQDVWPAFKRILEQDEAGGGGDES